MKLFISFATEEEVRFVVLVEPTSTVAGLRHRILADFRAVFPSRVPLCFFRMACADGFFLTDGATVGEVLQDGATVTCHRADEELSGAPLPERCSPEHLSSIFQTFTSQVSYVARAVCHAAASGEASEAVPILLAMLMLRGSAPDVRALALDALRLCAETNLSTFLSAGGLFVLLSMLSPSTKQGAADEVERSAQLLERLLERHGSELVKLMEESHPSVLLQKLALDSRSSAKTKQHAMASRKLLEGEGPRPQGPHSARLQSLGASLAQRPSQPGVRPPCLDGLQAKVAGANEAALVDLASDPTTAELLRRALRSPSLPWLPELFGALSRFAGHRVARQSFARHLAAMEVLEALPSAWPQWPSGVRAPVLQLCEEALKVVDARPLLLLVQDASPELQALGLRLLQHLADPESQRNWSLEPKTLNAALLQAMPKQPLPCLELLGTLALKEDFRSYFAQQQSLLKFLTHCCLQPDACGGAPVQGAAARCFANLGLGEKLPRHDVLLLRGLQESTEDLTVRAYLGILLGR